MPHVGIRQLLRSDRAPILMDGGIGGSLEERGVDVRNDLWSSVALLTEAGREKTRRLHHDFFAAGADIVIANVHNACPETCASFLEGADASSLDPPREVLEDADGLLDWIERTGVQVAVSSVPAEHDVVVAAGIGSQEPWATGTTRTKEAIEHSLGACVRALRRDARTFVVFETLSTPPEVAAVADLVRHEGLADFGLGLTCGPDGRTWGGLELGDVVDAFDGTGAAALFVQCTRYDLASLALADLLEALASAKDLDAVPGVYANDGRVWKDRRWHGARLSPAAYADAAEEWLVQGARIVGGCCGTTPEHIAELARRFKTP